MNITNQSQPIRVVTPSYVDGDGFFHAEVVRTFFSSGQQKRVLFPVEGFIANLSIKFIGDEVIMQREDFSGDFREVLKPGTHVYQLDGHCRHQLVLFVNARVPHGCKPMHIQSLGRVVRRSTGKPDNAKPILDQKLEELERLKKQEADRIWGGKDSGTPTA